MGRVTRRELRSPPPPVGDDGDLFLRFEPLFKVLEAL